MNIRLWGTRGSIPAPGPATARYGGNTSCVEVRLRDGLLILDAGSGIRPFGAAQGTCNATLLLTHYHWDHIQGLPFCNSAYDAASSIHVIGPETNGEGPKEFLAGQMMTPYFPATPSQLRGLKRFDTIPHGTFEVGSAIVTAGRVCHPGVTYGYRVQEDDISLVYISDNEVDLASPSLFADMVELAAGADLLIHDCQYTESEYQTKRGWGHSSPRQAARLATAAGVHTMMLFHHDPGHSDEQVEAIADEASHLCAFPLVIGREGDVLRVGPTPADEAVPEPRWAAL